MSVEESVSKYVYNLMYIFLKCMRELIFIVLNIIIIPCYILFIIGVILYSPIAAFAGKDAIDEFIKRHFVFDDTKFGDEE